MFMVELTEEWDDRHLTSFDLSCAVCTWGGVIDPDYGPTMTPHMTIEAAE